MTDPLATGRATATRIPTGGRPAQLWTATSPDRRAMLLVTHELGFAYHFATRVIFLVDGAIHEQGSPDEILKTPKKERTRAFLASHMQFSL